MENITANMTQDQQDRYAELMAADHAGDLSIEELDTVAAGLSVSSLLCAACPISSFSSVSN